MENYIKFRWTDQAKTDLLSIINVLDGTSKMSWSEVATKFTELHPNYTGKADALKMLYHRLKKTNLTALSLTDSENSEFSWTDKSKADLVSIVNSGDQAKRKNWHIIATKFKKLHPLYKSDNKSLCMQYLRLKDSYPTDPFYWGKSESQDLVRLVNLISVDGYPNWAKIFYTFQNYQPNYLGSKEDLKVQYERICNDDVRSLNNPALSDKLNKWDESMDVMLAQAVGHAQYIRSAQVRDGRRQQLDTLSKLSVKVFKEFYKARYGVEYIGIDSIVLKHFYNYKESLVPCSYACEADHDSFVNINVKKLLAFASKNYTLTFSKIFSECCHNCGFLFPRKRTNFNQKLLSDPINNTPHVVQMKTNVQHTYYIDEKYITCPECYKTPDWINDYSIAVNESYRIPVELSDLNEYEQNQIALCGGFYSLYRKQNMQLRTFEHRQGECNIGKRRDSDYHDVFISYFNIDRPKKLDSSNEKIKGALRWLRKHNRLFIDFLSNYETIYGYLMSCYQLRPEERIIQVSKGNLPEVVGKDTKGLFIPAENLKIENVIKPESHTFGIQHPLQSNLNKLRDIINVNYSDPDLEAKRWPKLFPSGNGSWRKNSSLKQQTYVKQRLLSIDTRFRRNNEFMFFWYDRLIKERLLYYNNRNRTVNVNELIESMQVKDVRENISRYGAVVPTSVSGSKTYWRARLLDLLSLTRDLGKPSLFVTLTQNDNWIELQEACDEISSEEMAFLDATIMQPAIGGKSVVNFPVETVVAFYKRLEMFMHSCIHNKNGPFGEVMDYWFRIEYQNRGALHCHMVLWICEDTLPADVVMAELPRYSGENPDIKHQTFLAREYVKTFQMHTCVLGGCRKDTKSGCKYGFPYKVQEIEEMTETKMGFKYIRRHAEDNRVVPYNMYALLCWNGHINVQKVTPNGIEAYLCKYVSKPERSIDIKEITSETEKFLKARVVGILECVAHLLQYHQVGSSRKTIFLPCDFKPNQRMLKRKRHLPLDNESDDIYYQTLLYKYLVRPKELHNLTYVDMYRFYDVVSANAREVYTQSMDYQVTESESDSEFQLKSDESQYEFKGRVRKIKSQRMKYICNGYKYVERGKAAVPRWRFLMPFGSESEKYYEQHLLLNVPVVEEDLNENGYPFSHENTSNTFVEECCLRGLVDSEETAKSALIGAIQRGFSVDRVVEIAKMFVDQAYVTNEYVDSILIPWQESMPANFDMQEESDAEYGEEISKMLDMRLKFDPYQTYFNSMTESQKGVMEWVDQKFNAGDQILAIISGGAGVGKSFITKALYSYFVEKKMVCILLATTGSAAHLISGTTVHYYLKIDIHGNKYLQPGTFSAKIVEDTDVIILDEFSMLSSDLLDQLSECTREYGKSKSTPFGGKHFFLIGDPCQLPAIGTSVFANSLLNVFNILLLKETVRQKDETFAAILNRVRTNNMTDSDKNILKTRYIHVSNIEYEDDMLIVTATRKKMRFYNQKFIANLPGDQVAILAQDFERDTNKEVSYQTKEKIRCYVKNLWDEQLTVKEGCIVRLLRNLDIPTGWVNSKRARVFRIGKDADYIVLQDINDPSKQLPLTKMRQPFKLGANLYYRYQFPVILGYATTVHAVQGTTVTGKYYVDLDRSFWESGQAFVALSRPKEMSQLYLLNTHFEKVILKSYYQDLLKWMEEVDEISIFRKPRYMGDFPLIPIDEQNLSKLQVFPAVPFQESKVPDKRNVPFKAPRKLKHSKPLVHPTSNAGEAIMANINSYENNAGSAINPRIYRLAEVFINACHNKDLIIDKLRFGTKLFNLLLEELNDLLSIHNVTDPLLLYENGQNVDNSVVRNWELKKSTTLGTFRKYVSQFQTELEMISNLISSLQICKYNGQEVDNKVTPFYETSKKWQPVNIVGDGRCFYHSVSVNLIGNTMLSNSLKLLIAFDICREFDIYDSIFARLASSANNVLLKTLSYNCWADMEIITATAYTLHRPINVISGLQGQNQVHKSTYNPLESVRDPIFIGHVKISKQSLNNDHFVALLHDNTYKESISHEEHLNVCMQQANNLTIELPDDDVEMIELSDAESL